MKALKYIFAKNIELYDIEKNMLQQSVIGEDDFILILKQDIMEGFCLTRNIPIYIKTLINFNDLIVYTFDHNEGHDVDEYDAFKIRFLQKCMLACNKIAVLLNANAIESWPLIQSYSSNVDPREHQALFTEYYKVYNFTEQLTMLLERPDSLNFECLLLKNLATFCWAFTNSICRLELNAKKGPLNLYDVIEPLRIYFRHADLCEGKSIQMRHPVCLLGPNTCENFISGDENSLKVANDFSKTASIHLIIKGSSLLPNCHCTRTYFILPKAKDERNFDMSQNLCQLTEIYLKLQWAFSEIVEQLESRSLAMHEGITGIIRAQLKEKLSKFNYSKIKISLNLGDIHEKVNDHVHLATLELSLFDLRDYSNNLIGSVSYADSLLISEIFLNGDRISTSVFNMTRHVPGFCCWGTELEPRFPSAKHSTRSSPALREKAMPVALIYQGINEVGIAPAFCHFNAGVICISNHHLGYYWFSVGTVTCFPTDSREFWGLWQFEVEDVFLECGARPSPAPFSLTSEGSKRILENIFSSNMPRCGAQCILVVLHLGTASHDALEHLQACKVDLDVNKRSEVALVSKIGLEARIKMALDSDKSQFFYPSLAAETPKFYGNTPVEMKTEESVYARNHLEGSLCLSAAQDSHRSLSTQLLLSRCGIPFTFTDEQKLFLKRKLCIVKGASTCMPESNSTFSLSCLGEKGLENRTLDGREQSDSLQMTIVCGLHGSHMVNVAGCIASIATDTTIWLVLHPKSLTEVPDLICSSLRKKSQQAGSGETRRFRILLVAPLWISVPEVLTQIESFLKPVFDKPNVTPICVTSTITCVDPRMCLMGSDGVTLPGLCPFFDRGWVNVIVFTNPTKMNSDAEASRARLLMEAIRQLNPQAVVLTAPCGKIKNCTQLSLLLNENLFEEEELQRCRLLTYAKHYPSLGMYQLKAINVQFKLPLDRTKWISALKSLRSNLSPFSDEPIVVYIEANLAFDEDPRNTFNCRYWPQIDVLKEAKNEFESNSGDISSKDAAPFSLNAHFFVIKTKTAIRSVYGGDCEEKLTNWLKVWLRECLRDAEKLKPLMEKEKLTERELDKIQDAYQLYPRPEGWYFTGSYYVHMMGEKSFRHPCFDQIVDKYIAEENEKIKKFNAALLKTPHADLFD